MKKEKILTGVLGLLTVLLMVTGIPAAAAEGREVRCYQAAQDPGPLGEEPINILLIGQDQRPGEPGKRSDSLILCTLLPGEKKLVLTSVLRDLYVKIPGYGYERINAAYAIGGVPMLDKTLEENFGISIDGNVEVDFVQFSGIVDQLGGVTLELREDEAREINRLVPDRQAASGVQTLDGRQALVYARIRRLDADSDFSRTQRQRKLLTALTDQYRDMDFPTMVKLTGTILPAVTTDLNGFEILTYGRLFLPMLKDMKIESHRIPEAGTCRDETIRGMQVLVPDLPAIRKQLGEILKPGQAS